eukprot:11200866-Alexandrium_andersonii.AAC.1
MRRKRSRILGSSTPADCSPWLVGRLAGGLGRPVPGQPPASASLGHWPLMPERRWVAGSPPKSS